MHSYISEVNGCKRSGKINVKRFHETRCSKEELIYTLFK